MVESVNRFYDSYYFRPKVAWRIVRDSLWDSHERKRLYHEAVDFMKLRADRRRVSRNRKGVDKKAIVAVPPMNPRSGIGESQGA
jgi:hypothetical protein